MLDGELGRAGGKHAAVAQGADSAAALLRNGVVVSAESEERFTGRKASGSFPRRAIDSVLIQNGISVGDLAGIAHGFDYRRDDFSWGADPLAQKRFDLASQEKQKELWKTNFGEDAAKLVTGIRHHECHAAMALLFGGTRRSIVLVADGSGESASTSLYASDGRDLKRLSHSSMAHSLGVFYSVVTHTLGFSAGGDEYKVMGLSSYGDPSRFRREMTDFLHLLPGGRYSVPLLQQDRVWPDTETHSRATRTLLNVVGHANRASLASSFRDTADLAAAAQERLQEALVHIVSHWTRELDCKNVLVSGGVAMNCSAMTAIERRLPGIEVRIPPASGDEGTAVGAAAILARAHGLQASAGSHAPFWGSLANECPDKPSERTPVGWKLAKVAGGVDGVYAEAARRLHGGQILGWVNQGMEFGARSLGARSILAAPWDKTQRDRINSAVKNREGFRPFAPAVRIEDAEEWFEVAGDLSRFEFMTLVANVRPDRKDLLAAVTHVDGTARVQVVGRNRVPALWELLRHFGRRTSIPVLLNTSFNVAGQPIVRTDEEAFETATKAGLDALVIGTHLYVQTTEVSNG